MPKKLCQKPSYTKQLRKRKHYFYDELEQSEESDSYVTEIGRRPKKLKKRIIYEDEIDGIPEYEPDSPTKEESKKTIIMRFKVNIEENNLIKQKNQKKFKKVLQNQ